MKQFLAKLRATCNNVGLDVDGLTCTIKQGAFLWQRHKVKRNGLEFVTDWGG